MEDAQKAAEAINKKLEALETAKENAATKEEVKAATDALEAFKSENEEALKGFAKSEDLEGLVKSDDLDKKLKALKEDLDEAHSEISSLKEKSTKKDGKLKLEKEVLEDIKKSLDDKGNRKKDFTVKAAAFASTAVTNNNLAYRESGIDVLPYRKTNLLDVFPRVQLPADHAGTIQWREWDEATTAAVVEAIEEGAPFPESTVKWKEGEAKMKKIGTSIPVSAEFAHDEASLYAELGSFMRDNVLLFEEEQIYKGTNATGQLNGFYTQAPAYVPAAKGFDAPNLYDLALDVQESIAKGKGAKFNADTIAMNLSTINTLYRFKNTQNDYLQVPFAVGQNGEISIAGMRIVESDLVEDDEMVVFDSMRATIFEGEDYELSTGYVANQFNEDEATLKARKRMLLRIKSNDLQGFRKVTSISAAIATLATTP